MKLKFIHIILSIAVAHLSTAQGEFPASYGRNDRFAFKEADFAFFQGDYSYALELFNDLYLVDSNFAAINHRIASCKLKLRKSPEEILPMLEKAVQQEYQEAWFEYGEVLHLLGELDAARTSFDNYLIFGGENHSPEEINQKLRTIANAEFLLENPIDVIIQNAGPNINTEFDEHTPALDASGKLMAFTSRRPGSTAQQKDPDGNYFEDIYISEQGSEGWNSAKNAGIPLNSETHDATVSMSADGHSMILYRTSENKTGGDLYTSKFSNGKWQKPEKLSDAINSEFQEASACFSSDGQTLIFSSNRPGGMGGKDLYRVKKLPNGDWSLPRNLGPTINTPLDEDSPVLINEDRTLYFASNGHNTIGGFDLFASEADEDGNWKNPHNLGYPLNTFADDIYLFMLEDGKTAYFNSARKGGFGGQDIYKIEFIYRNNKNIAVRGKILDENGEALQAKITVIDERNKSLNGEYRSKSSTGSFALVVNPLTPYKIIIEAEGYKSYNLDLELEMSEESFVEHDIKAIILRKE